MGTRTQPLAPHISPSPIQPQLNMGIYIGMSTGMYMGREVSHKSGPFPRGNSSTFAQTVHFGKRTEMEILKVGGC